MSLSGTATVANYQAALRSATYHSTSGNSTATSATRTITWKVTDADSYGVGAETSTGVTSTINLTAVNDAPVVGGVLGATVAESGTVVITSDDLNTTDADGLAADLVYTVTALPASGNFALMARR